MIWRLARLTACPWVIESVLLTAWPCVSVVVEEAVIFRVRARSGAVRVTADALVTVSVRSGVEVRAIDWPWPTDSVSVLPNVADWLGAWA